MYPAYCSPCGITIRKDHEALFGYLPKEGFAFFAPASDFDMLQSLLSERKSSGFPIGYEQFVKTMRKPFPPDSARSLGNPAHPWETLPLPATPLIINWMITGTCNHRCIYCYAQDIMSEADPTDDIFLTTIENIRAYNPLAFVVTGGEPSLSKHFVEAIEKLSKFTSVVVDTNATALKEEHISIFIDNNVHVRFSLDSNRNVKNSQTRIPLVKKDNMYLFAKIWENLSKLSNNGVNLTINTVATKYNYRDIQGLERDISRFNISKLRIRFVEKTKTIRNYAEITGSDSKINAFIKYTKEKNNNDISIPTYFTMNRPRNSIVIVSPKGNFLTESQFVDQGKILIDPKNPTKPSLDALRKRVDMHAHSARYLYI